MPASAEERFPTIPTQPFRLDVPLHYLLRRTEGAPGSAPQELPEPVFPQHPELLHEIDEADIAAQEN